MPKGTPLVKCFFFNFFFKLKSINFPQGPKRLARPKHTEKILLQNEYRVIIVSSVYSSVVIKGELISANLQVLKFQRCRHTVENSRPSV